jgi:hypothetical protein
MWITDGLKNIKAEGLYAPIRHLRATCLLGRAISRDQVIDSRERIRHTETLDQRPGSPRLGANFPDDPEMN